MKNSEKNQGAQQPQKGGTNPKGFANEQTKNSGLESEKGKWKNPDPTKIENPSETKAGVNPTKTGNQSQQTPASNGTSKSGVTNGGASSGMNSGTSKTGISGENSGRGISGGVAGSEVNAEKESGIRGTSKTDVSNSTGRSGKDEKVTNYNETEKFSNSSSKTETPELEEYEEEEEEDMDREEETDDFPKAGRL